MNTHFFLSGQFWACNGSSGPTNSTTYSSWAGSSGGYGFPRPISGSGLLLSLLLPVRLLPIVPACWLLAVWIRLRTVGCLSISDWVLNRLTPSLRTAEPSDDELDVVETVSSLSTSWWSLPWPSSYTCGVAWRSAAITSRSAASIEVMRRGEGYSTVVRKGQQELTGARERHGSLYIFISCCLCSKISGYHRPTDLSLALDVERVEGGLMVDWL